MVLVSTLITHVLDFICLLLLRVTTGCQLKHVRAYLKQFLMGFVCLVSSKYGAGINLGLTMTVLISALPGTVIERRQTCCPYSISSL